jgi:hypothetical protein
MVACLMLKHGNGGEKKLAPRDRGRPRQYRF